MASPSVDVVIPVFNGERFLEQAIASVLDQSLVPAKVLVVDDGSTDSSREIAMRFGNPVSCLAQANQGPSAARNRGIAAASSEWVAFLDADDYWMPGRLERMLDVVERNPDVDFIYTGLTRIAADGSEEPLRAVSPDRIRERLRYDCPIFPSTVMARRSLLSSHPWSTEFRSSEDWWLFYRLSRQANFAAIEQPTVVHRLHDKSLTHRDWRSVLHYAQRVAARIQEDFSGFERIRLKRKVDARLLASAALAARSESPRTSLGYITGSLLAWPFPGLISSRYKLFLLMLAKSLGSGAPQVRT